MIKVGEIYKYSSETTYHIDELLWSADGYEEIGLLPKERLEDGEVMQAGTRYTRTFINFFEEL